MFEFGVLLLFLFSLWALGVAFLRAFGCSEVLDWIAVPLGLCLTVLVHNACYEPLGLAAQTIQCILIVLTGLAVVFLLYKKVFVQKLYIFLSVAAVFCFLALPAWINGEQYYVFRGNYWDHFNYIHMALTVWGNPLDAYPWPASDLSWYAGKDLFLEGRSILLVRPGVSQVLAGLLCSGIPNLHLAVYLYLMALWAVSYSSIYFAWQLILHARKESDIPSLWLRILPPLAVTIGFWGQYVFDINAWSQLASVAPLVAITFLYMAWLAYRLGLSNMDIGRPAYPSLMVLGAGGMVFYPESAGLHACVLGLATILLLVICRQRIRFSRNLCVALLLLPAGMVLLFSPAFSTVMSTAYNQIRGSALNVVDWWQYFDNYWWGLHGAPKKILRALQVVPSVLGMYFITPQYTLPRLIVIPWVAAVALFALAAMHRFSALFRRPSPDEPVLLVFLRMLCISACVPMVYYLASRNFWPLGKALSFVAPYFLFFLLAPLAAKNFWRENSNMRRSWYVLALIILVGHLSFGLIARPVSAIAAQGIGYDARSYPSIQGKKNKKDYRWQLDISSFSPRSNVCIVDQDNPFYHQYIKQKLTYAGIPYYYSEQRKTQQNHGGYTYPPIPKREITDYIVARENTAGVFELHVIPASGWTGDGQ
ncbi:membrane hypothetical protein [uncultured delta proteobacterium]|uniref:Glycosyltransferase RgtA/B/C/D-like domain-containing protein n=1 Tax=uncultured delta proteobacterium TaxID=34034 RepID=A0A212KGR2_9DELT|nr:membrane hypothetical protein [uncultured delta proteobacterium]